jgi:hypothetical protein
MEKIVEKMQDEKQGIRVRTVKSLRSKIPSVFTGESHLPLACLFTIFPRKRKLRSVFVRQTFDESRIMGFFEHRSGTDIVDAEDAEHRRSK